jgi:hypothetical protein
MFLVGRLACDLQTCPDERRGENIEQRFDAICHERVGVAHDSSGDFHDREKSVQQNPPRDNGSTPLSTVLRRTVVRGDRVHTRASRLINANATRKREHGYGALQSPKAILFRGLFSA